MKKLLTILACALVATGAMAGNKPIQLSLTPDVAIYDRTETIEGLTVGVWSENPQSALAFGLVNGSTGKSAGLSLAFILNYAESYKGVQLAPVNYVKGDFLGWQYGFVNYAEGTMKGLQTGAVNYAGTLTGVQFGFVNFAEKAKAGIQVGLLNIIPENAWFTDLPDGLTPAMVFVNWRF